MFERQWHFFLARNRLLAAQSRHLHLHRQLAPPHLYRVSNGFWLRPGIESTVTALLLAAIAVALIAGGRRWGAFVIVAFPLANVLGWFSDGAPLGLSWFQQSASPGTWFAVGTAVDSLLLITVVALLLRAVPARFAATSSRTALTRALPLLIILIGWWVARGQASDPAHRVWLGQAIAYVLIAALIAGSSLPVAARAAVIVGVLPMCAPALLDDLIGFGGPHFDAMTFLHDAAFAAATALYVAAAPMLVRRYPGLNRPVVRPSHVGL